MVRYGIIPLDQGVRFAWEKSKLLSGWVSFRLHFFAVNYLVAYIRKR